MRVLDRAIARSVRVLPRRLVGRVASRYIAGEDLPSALATIERVGHEGCVATLDVLGEHISSADEAGRMREAYEAALAGVAERALPSGISVKLTSLGLGLDRELCRANLERVLGTAARLDRFVRVDMEESIHTGATLDLVVDARRRGFRVGTVIQARLHRSRDDVARLVAEDVPVRLVKGIYLEPEAIACTGDQEIRQAFICRLEQLLRARGDVAIATHDDVLVERALALLRDAGLPAGRSEFQMLLGVRPELRRRLVAAGNRVRVYVPFGRDWFAYSMRRLQENPRMATLVARAMFISN
jgi:proline dehydrogenase